MNAQARDQLRAEIIAFACEVNDMVDDHDAFVAAITAFFARLAGLYRCSALAIRPVCPCDHRGIMLEFA